MTDIWDEKPKADLESDYGSYGYYKEPMDVWLEKLKKYYETKDYIDEKIAEGLIVDKKLEAIKTFAQEMKPSYMTDRILKILGVEE